MALLGSPDDTPHVQRKLHPTDAAKAEWLKPEVAVTAMAHDSLMLPLLLMARVKPEFIEKQPTLLASVFSRLDGTEEKPQPQPGRRRKVRSPKDIRAAVGAAYGQ